MKCNPKLQRLSFGINCLEGAKIPQSYSPILTVGSLYTERVPEDCFTSFHVFSSLLLTFINSVMVRNGVPLILDYNTAMHLQTVYSLLSCRITQYNTCSSAGCLAFCQSLHFHCNQCKAIRLLVKVVLHYNFLPYQMEEFGVGGKKWGNPPLWATTEQVLAESTAMLNRLLVLQALCKVLQAWYSELISQ